MNASHLLYGFIFSICSCLLVACGGAEANSVRTASVPFEEISEAPDLCILDWEEHFVQDMREPGCVGAAVAIVKDSRVVFLKGYGLKRRGEQDTIGVNTVFRIGSLSKGFASVLAGMLVENAMFDWDDPVKEHLDYFRANSGSDPEEITINHILSHTTGLPRHAYTNLIEDGWDVERIGEELGTVPLVGVTGKSYSYQNAAYALIEDVMLQATGREYTELLEDMLFEPLGMHNASSSYADIMSCEDRAAPHSYSRRPAKITRRYYNSVASGGINASIADMAVWIQVLLGYRPEIISESTLDQVFEPQVSTRRQRRYYNRWRGSRSSHYARGWRIIEFDNYEIVHHGGYVNGFRGEIAIDRTNGIGICVLFNSPCRRAERVIPDFFESYFSCNGWYESG